LYADPSKALHVHEIGTKRFQINSHPDKMSDWWCSYTTKVACHQNASVKRHMRRGSPIPAWSGRANWLDRNVPEQSLTLCQSTPANASESDDWPE
jgi:hypothetical protein